MNFKKILKIVIPLFLGGFLVWYSLTIVSLQELVQYFKNANYSWIALGLFFGVLGYKNKTVETILNPLLNVAQTMPHFSYLVPAMVFFGVGDHAGALATIIFATPPMVRLTMLGLKNVPSEVADAGKMSGCSEFQLLYKVLIPTARRDILIGVNQVIMQCLAMAVIASFIMGQSRAFVFSNVTIVYYSEGLAGFGGRIRSFLELLLRLRVFLHRVCQAGKGYVVLECQHFFTGED